MLFGINTNSWASDEFELRVSIPLPNDAQVVQHDNFITYILPSCKVARMWYTGPFEGLPSAWNRLNQFINEQQLIKHAGGEFFETYLRGPGVGVDPKQHITQLSRILA